MSLEQTTLIAQSRDTAGKGPSRRLRRAGLVPAIIYGGQSAPTTIALEPAALRKALATPHRYNTVLTIKIAEAEKLVLLKDYQQHPVSRALLHVDFQEVLLDQAVTVEVPVVLTGRAQGVIDGGLLTQVGRTITLKALPRAIPANLSVDVTDMRVNQTLHESDLKLPEGVQLASRKNLTIATLSAPEEEATPATPAATGKKK